MSRAQLRFQVDSRLATLLSQEYSSSERALKELVDNAWDADAEHVSITLPKPLSGGSIVIEDDGSGMTEEELRRHYLAIASDRRSRRGERTSGRTDRSRAEKASVSFPASWRRQPWSSKRVRAVVCAGFRCALMTLRVSKISSS